MKEIFNLTYLGLFPLGKSLSGKGMGIEMQKYNYDMDVSTPNSNSQIIRYIEEKKEILEFGPAHGRLTRFLHDELKCIVDIVELDEESGRNASQYARTSCIGEVKGNIEKYEWEKILGEKKYDYIIFADVLEHLFHPERVLKECKKFLKENGSILCSVPNIAHSSILISLWNNDFTYNNVGLLDNTHVHFFTRNTFMSMAEECGYCVKKVDEITSKVGTNEIHYTYEMVPSEVESELRFRKDGEAYQYVFQLKDAFQINDTASCIRNYGNGSGFSCSCYVKQKSDPEFSDMKVIKKNYASKKVDVYFNLKDFNDIEGIRVDLIEKNAILKINDVDLDGEQKEIDTNGYKLADGIYGFLGTSQIYLNVSMPEVSYVHVSFEILFLNNKNMESLIALIGEQKKEIQLTNERINNVLNEYDELQIKIATIQQKSKNVFMNKEEQLKTAMSEIEVLQNQINENKQYMESQEKRIAELEVGIDDQKEENKNLVNQLSKKQKIIADMEDEKMDVMSEIEVLQNQINENKQYMEFQEKRIAELEVGIDDQKEENKNLVNQLSKKQKIIADMEDEKMDVSSKIQNQNKTIDKLEEEKKANLDIIEKLQEEKNFLQKEFEKKFWNKVKDWLMRK